MTDANFRSAVSLRARIAKITAEYGVRFRSDVEHDEILDRKIRWLKESGAVASALQAGDMAPDFVLTNQHDERVRFADHLVGGPVVLLFFRGQWCPYCSVTLTAWEEQLENLQACGGSLLAISPQTPQSCLTTAKKLGLTYDLLSDVGSEIARMFRLSYRLPADMQALFIRYGVRLVEFNGGDSVHLPMPATFVIDRTAVIRLSDVHGEPAARLDPMDAVASLRGFL